MTLRIAIVPGDGIGKEVVAEGIRLLELVEQKTRAGLAFDHKDWGADRWLKDRVGLPKGALEELLANNVAVYFGALGDPRIPDMAHGRYVLAITHARLGALDRAAAEVAYALRLEPWYRIGQSLTARYFKRGADTEHLVGGLRMAGFPE